MDAELGVATRPKSTKVGAGVSTGGGMPPLKIADANGITPKGNPLPGAPVWPGSTGGGIATGERTAIKKLSEPPAQVPPTAGSSTVAAAATKEVVAASPAKSEAELALEAQRVIAQRLAKDRHDAKKAAAVAAAANGRAVPQAELPGGDALDRA